MEEVKDFDFEQIEGGTRLKCKTKKDKAALKKLMEQLFKGDLLKKVFEQLFAAFDGMGNMMSDLGKTISDLGNISSDEDKKDEI
jgi:hypothetical protein